MLRGDIGSYDVFILVGSCLGKLRVLGLIDRDDLGYFYLYLDNRVFRLLYLFIGCFYV